MEKIKSFLLLLVAMLSVTLVNARQISEQEAQQKAEAFLSKSGQYYSNRRKASHKTPKLVLASNRDELYVFNDKANGGYIVISGDNRMPDVLAYSYDGLYDENDIPGNMKAWMDDYAGQVAYLRTHPEAKVKSQTATERENIEPLLTCWFGQSAPYNNKCPEINGNHCPTGCVATAMAQIMYYYQWPKQTTEVIPGYTTKVFGIAVPEQPITTIDWDNIRGDYSKYGNGYSDEESDAVSTLMWLCGTSVKMEYMPDGSGATGDSAALALSYYFGYDDLLEVVSRDQFNYDYYDSYYDDINLWEDLIYEELDGGRPVYYGAYSEKLNAWHAFIMDGYVDGYFHVNWGWGGSYSYVLMPEVGGFNLYHTATVGIRPVYPEDPCRYAVLDDGKMTLYYDTEKAHRSGKVINHKYEWSNYRNVITECVIDPSFANLKQRSLKRYFSNWNQLRSIDGMENLRADNIVNISEMFYRCSSLTSLDLSGFKTDNVKIMSDMFSGCSSLTNLDLSGFRTDNVTKMRYMFYNCSSLANIDLSSFNTINVKNMSCMFNNCSSLANLDLSSFETDNVTNMESMFGGCSSLASLDLSSFKTDNVTNMGGMFGGCSSLASLDLSSFKTDNVTNMGGMFGGCSSLASLDLSSFKTDNVTNMGRMFGGCSSFVSLDLSSFKTNNVKNMNNMFYGCNSLKGIYVDNTWTTVNVIDGNDMFQNCPKLVGGAGTVIDWNHVDHTYAHIDGGTINPGYFREKNAPEPYAVLSDNNTSLTFYYGNQLESQGCMDVVLHGGADAEPQWISHSGEITTVLFDESFSSCTALTSTSNWFKNCSKLDRIIGIDNLRTDSVTNMYHMFYGCSSLSSLDLSGFKTDGVTNMAGIFYGCSSLTSLDLSGFKTDNVTNMYQMFYGCSSLTSLDLSGFKTDNVTNMIQMFNRCSSLTNLDLSSFNTENVGSLSSMFGGCSSLVCLDLSSFNTENVGSLYSMFGGCSSLVSLDLSSFKTDKVTDMNRLFYGCKNLKKIYVDSGWTTCNVTSGNDMFWECKKLIGGAGTKFSWDHMDYTYAHIDGGTANPGYFRKKNAPEPYTVLSDDNTVLTFYYDTQMESQGGVDLLYSLQWWSHSGEITTVVFDESFASYTELSSMRIWFSGCSKLSSIIGIENLRTDNVTNLSRMFSDCGRLTSLDLSSFKTDNVTDMSEMFYGCNNLKKIYVDSGWTISNVTSGDYMFWGCYNLVGGAGTTYNSSHNTVEYAHVDGGETNPGYLTYKDTLVTLTYMVDGKEYRSYRLKCGDEIVPEPVPIKDGYVFLWNEIPETMPARDVEVTGRFYLYGDVNTDEEVDVVDVVDIARFVVATPSEKFREKLADLNADNNVNIGDAVTLVNHIAGDQNYVKALAPSCLSYDYDQCQLQLQSAGQNALSLCFDGEADFTAFQFDVDVSEGTDISTISFNGMRKDGHKLLYNKLAEGRYRVTAFSFSNAVFRGSKGELLQFCINGQTTDDICVHDIHFITTNGKDITFDALYVSGTETGIAHTSVNEDSDTIYDLLGRKLSKIQRGVNIINGKKVVSK